MSRTAVNQALSVLSVHSSKIGLSFCKEICREKRRNLSFADLKTDRRRFCVRPFMERADGFRFVNGTNLVCRKKVAPKKSYFSDSLLSCSRSCFLEATLPTYGRGSQKSTLTFPPKTLNCFPLKNNSFRRLNLHYVSNQI